MSKDTSQKEQVMLLFMLCPILVHYEPALFNIGNSGKEHKDIKGENNEQK